MPRRTSSAARRASPHRAAPGAHAASERELREYHESPPAIVRDMEDWLAIGERRAAAERVRRWLVESYELAPAKVSPTRARARPRATKKRH